MAPADQLDQYTSVAPGEIMVRAPFSELFRIDAAIRSKVTESMKAIGYDPSKPINVWRQANVVVDGHTRRLAAIDVGFSSVPICFHDFADEDEAMKYAIDNQRARRNITDAEMQLCIEAVDRRKCRGGDQKSVHAKSKASREAFDSNESPRESKSASVTAKIVGVSTSKVEESRRLTARAPVDPKPREEVLSGRMKIHTAAKLVPKIQGRWPDKEIPNGEAKTKPEPKHVPVIPKPHANGKSTEDIYRVRVPTEEEQAWLESIPLRARVVAHRFDEDALLYRSVRDHLEKIRENIKEIVGRRSRVAAGPLYLRLQGISGIESPDHWPVCRACNGHGEIGGICTKCRGCGYTIS